LSSGIPMSVDREFIEYVRRVVIDWYRVYGDRYLPWRGRVIPGVS